MNSRHADSLEALQKEHAAEMSKLRLQAEAARRDAETRSKNFNALVETTTKEVKMKEKDTESARAELHSLEDSLKLLCADLLSKCLGLLFLSV
jgi:hypothetical protein